MGRSPEGGRPIFNQKDVSLLAQAIFIGVRTPAQADRMGPTLREAVRSTERIASQEGGDPAHNP
jgi:hypothetical protein